MLTPPYVMSTRDAGSDYAFEMSDKDHIELCTFLRGLEGKVVLSGYPNPIYDDRLHGWKKVERKALADGARPRTEVLWLNFDPAYTPPPGGLFAETRNEESDT